LYYRHFPARPCPGLMQFCLIHNSNQQRDGTGSLFFR